MASESNCKYGIQLVKRGFELLQLVSILDCMCFASPPPSILYCVWLELVILYIQLIINHFYCNVYFSRSCNSTMAIYVFIYIFFSFDLFRNQLNVNFIFTSVDFIVDCILLTIQFIYFFYMVVKFDRMSCILVYKLYLGFDDCIWLLLFKAYIFLLFL